MAREVILFIAASIDGFIADKAGGVAWLEENIRGDEEDRSYDEMYEKIDTVVMGRTTYDQVTQELSPDVYFMKTSILISLPLIQNHQLLQELLPRKILSH